MNCSISSIKKTLAAVMVAAFAFSSAAMAGETPAASAAQSPAAGASQTDSLTGSSAHESETYNATVQKHKKKKKKNKKGKKSKKVSHKKKHGKKKHAPEPAAVPADNTDAGAMTNQMTPADPGNADPGNQGNTINMAAPTGQ